MSLVIKGVSPLGEKARDVYVADGVIVDEASTGSTGGGKPTVIDAEGLVALPGLVDLHTHLREPGREDAETVLTGSRAAALGGYTAVLAMANTSPVTDTAEAAERVLDLGRAAGLVDVQPVGAVTRGLAGEELAELGLMARSRAKVRVFSDDGKCVHDPRVMRRCPGVRPRLRRRRLPALAGPRPGRAERLLPRGGALRSAGTPGLARHRRGDHRRPGRDARPPHQQPGARRARVHRRVRRGDQVGEGAGDRRHRRGHAAPPAAHHRPARRL